MNLGLAMIVGSVLMVGTPQARAEGGDGNGSQFSKDLRGAQDAQAHQKDSQGRSAADLKELQSRIAKNFNRLARAGFDNHTGPLTMLCRAAKKPPVFLMIQETSLDVYCKQVESKSTDKFCPFKSSQWPANQFGIPSTPGLSELLVTISQPGLPSTVVKALRLSDVSSGEHTDWVASDAQVKRVLDYAKQVKASGYTCK